MKSSKSFVFTVAIFISLMAAPVAAHCCDSASDSDESIYKIYIHKTAPTTRGIVEMPEASVYNDVLTVSFDGSGVYSLYVEDSYGVTVYQSMLPANGMEYDYDLSGVGEGLFRLILSNGDDEYEGYFTLR